MQGLFRHWSRWAGRRQGIPTSLQELSEAGLLLFWDQLLAALLFIEGALPEEAAAAPQSQSSLSNSGIPGPHPLSTATTETLK